MRLTIEVELGNDAMRTGEDVSRLLLGLSGRVRHRGELDLGHGGRLMDINGNSVGTWEVES